MTAETRLSKLLARLQPRLLADEYVFCTIPDGRYGDYAELNPLACYQEAEGLSLVLTKASALTASLPFESTFRGITLTVHSSLNAVGLTAAIANKLTAAGISANIVAACHHDHVFVPAPRAEEALRLLASLSSKQQ